MSSIVDVKNYVLAQHAFIKAVTLENNSAVAWCNLGTLYFMLDDVRLANKAYSEAQRSDPDYVNCWIGQVGNLYILTKQEQNSLY